jgi:hypothetical protein
LYLVKAEAPAEEVMADTTVVAVDTVAVDTVAVDTTVTVEVLLPIISDRQTKKNKPFTCS